MKIFFIASDKIVDDEGSFSKTNKILNLAHHNKLKIETLVITPLSHPWDTPLKKNEFKSGASAIAAIDYAKKILRSKKFDVVVIEGRDALKSGYEKKFRNTCMELYEHNSTPLDGYERLTKVFLEQNKISESEYFNLRDKTFINLAKTWNGPLPHEKWFEPLTHYFRGVDCANPNIDFAGRIILAGPRVSNILKTLKKDMIEVAGNSSIKLKVDGLESLEKVKNYRHLNRAFKMACNEAKINFANLLQKKTALMEVYTCYPVVPLGFLLSTKLSSRKNLSHFLETTPLTITGGLNLAKAPWNLTSLNALIEMRQKLIRSKKIKYGLVHGNGSLGNQQGITILRSA